jgi:hypothetical protein
MSALGPIERRVQIGRCETVVGVLLVSSLQNMGSIRDPLSNDPASGPANAFRWAREAIVRRGSVAR